MSPSLSFHSFGVFSQGTCLLLANAGSAGGLFLLQWISSSLLSLCLLTGDYPIIEALSQTLESLPYDTKLLQITVVVVNWHYKKIEVNCRKHLKP